MGRRLRKIKGKILAAPAGAGAVLFQAGAVKTWLPKSLAWTRTDGQGRYAPGEILVEMPAKMAARKGLN